MPQLQPLSTVPESVEVGAVPRRKASRTRARLNEKETVHTHRHGTVPEMVHRRDTTTQVARRHAREHSDHDAKRPRPATSHPMPPVPAPKSFEQLQALLEPDRWTLEARYAMEFLVLPTRRPPRLPVKMIKRRRRHWRRIVVLLISRSRRAKRTQQTSFDGWRAWLVGTVIQSVVEGMGDYTILRAAVVKLFGGYLSLALKRWKETGDTKKRSWYYSRNSSPFSRLISLHPRRAEGSTERDLALTELLHARKEAGTWVACHACLACMCQQRCTQPLDISGPRPTSSKLLWQLRRLIDPYGGNRVGFSALHRHPNRDLAAFIRPNAGEGQGESSLLQGRESPVRPKQKTVHFADSYSQRHWHAVQAKLKGKSATAIRRPRLWTRLQMQIRRSPATARQKQRLTANRKSREEESAARDAEFRAGLPAHAKEAYELQLEEQRRRALQKKERELKLQQWKQSHTPSALLFACQAKISSAIYDWQLLQERRRAAKLAEQEAERLRAEAARAARVARRREERRLMGIEDDIAHQVRWMEQGDDWDRDSDGEGGDRGSGDADAVVVDDDPELTDWGVPIADRRGVSGVAQLNFRARGSAPSAWAVFLERALPFYTKLKVLDLSENPELKVDIAELVAKLPPTLKELRLNGTECFGDARNVAWGDLPKLKRLNLTGTKVAGSKDELQELLPSECKVYPGTAGILAAKELDLRRKGWDMEVWTAFIERELPQREGLQVLRLAGNPQLKVDISELVAKLPSTVTKLFLDGTKVYGKSVNAPWGKLTNLEMVNLTGTQVAGSEQELRAVLPPTCKRVYVANDGWEL